MIKVYFQEEDGTYNAIFSEHYLIDQTRGVYSVRYNRFLKIDDKKRVWLSLGSTKKRFRFDKLWKDSLSAQKGALVKKITNTNTEAFTLDNDYVWRKLTQAKYCFSTSRVYEPIIVKQIPIESIYHRFIQLLTKPELKDHPPYQCNFMQFARWSVKYEAQLKTLPDEYDLYRHMPSLLTDDIQKCVLTCENRFLYFNDDGSLTVSANRGFRRMSPGDPDMSSHNSSLLLNNRLTFKETHELISGPYAPLLTWVFRGRPQQGWVLFNVTGNNKDYDASNWVWIDPVKETTYTWIREQLTQRWHMEVKG